MLEVGREELEMVRVQYVLEVGREELEMVEQYSMYLRWAGGNS